MERIPDIIDELHAARLLDNEGEIIERHEQDPGCRIHIDAVAMAGQLADWFRAGASTATGTDPDACHELARLADYADQLLAHHLDMLDRLNPI